MHVGAVLVLTLASVANAQPAAATDFIYVYKNRPIRFSVITFDPPVSARSDAARLNRETALNCAILFRSRLGAGDLEGASKLTTDPARFVETYAKYRTRVGETVYREQFEELSKEDLRYSYELIIGTVHALYAEGKPGLAHYVRLRDGRFFVDYPDTAHLPQDVSDLSVLVNAIADGKLKIPAQH